MTGRAPDPDKDATDLQRVLPCGRRPATLLGLAADGQEAEAELAGHTRSCQHCQAELDVLSERWRLVRRAAEAAPRAPSDLVPRVLAALEGLRGRPHAEPVEVGQEGGWLRVAERVVILLARQLAVEVAVDHDARIGVVRADEDGLHLHVSLRYGVHAGAVADALHERVSAGLMEHLGRAVPAVHVVIDDVHPSPPFG